LAEPCVLRLEGRDPALQFFYLDWSHGHARGETAKTAVG